MALWLELIPRLHKSDQLNARYHQLDNYDNLSTFEDQEFTRLTNAAMLWQDELAFHPATLGHDLKQSTNALTYQPYPRRPTSPSRRHQNRSTATPHPPAPQPKVVLQASTKQTTNPRPETAESFKAVATNALSLSVTVGVGCALFLLNLLIFAVLYYQKDRMRRELRLHCAGELSLLKKDQELIAHQTYRLRCSPGLGDADSNGDATTLAPHPGPPPPPPTRHQLVTPQDGGTASSLQRRTSPIPVAVPEAPYAVITSSSVTVTTSTATTSSSSSSSFCSALPPSSRCHTAPSSSSNHVTGSHTIKYLPLSVDENSSNSFNASTSV